jgi:hypothetical protein
MVGKTVDPHILEMLEPRRGHMGHIRRSDSGRPHEPLQPGLQVGESWDMRETRATEGVPSSRSAGVTHSSTSLSRQFTHPATVSPTVSHVCGNLT